MSRLESSRNPGAWSNTSPTETKQLLRHHSVHWNSVNAATENVTLDAHLKMDRKTGSGKNKKKHMMVCEYIRIEVDGPQRTIYYTAGVHWELRDQFIATHNGKPRWLTKAFVRTFYKMKHQDDISTGIVADLFTDKRPQERTKQALTTLTDATKAYLIEVIAELHMYMQQLVSCRFPTCLQLWQGKEVRHS